MKKLNIAVIGFGRSGCNILGAFLRTADNDICNVKYVVEADPARAAAAREIFGCETLTNYTELFPLVNGSTSSPTFHTLTCTTPSPRICCLTASTSCSLSSPSTKSTTISSR